MKGRRLRLALVAFVSVALVAGCAQGGARWVEPDATTPPPLPALRLVYSHDADAVDVSPGQPVTVQAVNGTIETVSLTSNIGEIPGDLDRNRTTWRASQDLEFGKTYTLTVSGLGEDGEAVEETRTFSTVSVDVGYYWNVYFKSSGMYYGVALDGGTFGVGQTIVARFDDAVDRAVAERTLSVQTTPHVEGAWHWMSDMEVHWRPQTYWTPGTTITVSADILGVAVTSPQGGRVLHGQENKTATFTIGSSKIAKIDDNTKMMEVFIDGAHARSIPVSMGRPDGYRDTAGVWHDWRTTSGVHIVTEKQNPVVMRPDLPCPEGKPGTPGCDPQFYLETIDYAVRVTDSGIYVHSAPWSEWAQGYSNQSHGCINIADEIAPWFYDTFGPGDVVEIVNTGQPLPAGDGLTDWNVAWDEWLAGSAL